jgi:hypothetical protein
MKHNVAHTTRIHPQNAGKRREKNCSEKGSRNLSPKRKRKGPDLGRRKQPKKKKKHNFSRNDSKPYLVFCFPTTTTASHNFLDQIRQFDNGWKGSNCKDLSDATEICQEQPTVQKHCSQSLAMAMREKRKDNRRQQEAKLGLLKLLM